MAWGLAFGSGPFVVLGGWVNIRHFHCAHNENVGRMAMPTTTHPTGAGRKKNPMCDCGTCCDTCGHDPNCASHDTPAYDPSDDYDL